MLEKSLKYDPNNADAWFLLGRIHYDEGDKYKALECINKAIVARSGFYQALQLRASIYMGNKEYSKAIKDLDSCLVLYPYNALALGNRGYLKYMTKDYKGAYTDTFRSRFLYFL